MKITAQEEYGLRCLMQIARRGPGGSLTIPQLAMLERISEANVAKMLRILRQGGLVSATRGQSGGYVLARPAEEIIVGHALAVLGGRLFGPSFCDHHAGAAVACANTVECSIRALWRNVQGVVDQMLSRMTLADLIRGGVAAPPPALPAEERLPALPSA